MCFATKILEINNLDIILRLVISREATAVPNNWLHASIQIRLYAVR